MPYELKLGVRGEGLDVELPAREKIIQADDVVAVSKEPFAKVGAQEARTPSDKNAQTGVIVPEIPGLASA